MFVIESKLSGYYACIDNTTTHGCLWTTIEHATQFKTPDDALNVISNLAIKSVEVVNFDSKKPATPQKPAFKKPTLEQLENRYKYHAPKGDQTQRYATIRNLICDLAIKCVELTPCSPEQSKALNALDDAMFNFNASIARNE